MALLDYLADGGESGFGDCRAPFFGNRRRAFAADRKKAPGGNVRFAGARLRAVLMERRVFYFCSDYNRTTRDLQSNGIK